MEREINLKELFSIIRRRFWVIIIITTIVTAVGYYYNASNKGVPLYQSSASLIVDAKGADMNTLRVVMRDPIMMNKVIAALQLNRSPERLASQIGVSNIDDSKVMKITVTDTNPELAAEIANNVASVFQNEIGNIVNFEGVSLGVLILSEAVANPIQINPSGNKLVYIALIGGLMIGIGFVFLLHSLDDTVTSKRDVENQLGILVLGTVQKMNKKNIEKTKHKKIRLEGGGVKVGVD